MTPRLGSRVLDVGGHKTQSWYILLRTQERSLGPLVPALLEPTCPSLHPTLSELQSRLYSHLEPTRQSGGHTAYLERLALKRPHWGRPAGKARGGLLQRPAESTWWAREEGVSEMIAPSGPPHTPATSTPDERRAAGAG